MSIVSDCSILLKTTCDNNSINLSRFLNTINAEDTSKITANKYLNEFVPGTLKTKNKSEVTNSRNSFIHQLKTISKFDIDLTTISEFVE